MVPGVDERPTTPGQAGTLTAVHELESLIVEALSYHDPARCNRAITEAHFQLSERLRAVIGEEAGANFHSWAVWGSKKAGVTIRQEDLDTALKDATVAGGVTGSMVGLAVARVLGRRWLYPVGLTVGGFSGALTGRAIARWSRRKAARLVLEGNRLVLDDIGRKTARFCAAFEGGGLSREGLMTFCRSVPEPLLSQAFQHYGEAALQTDLDRRCQHAYFANLLAILHEHRKLQPYIARSMPFIVKRCVTKRLMKFEIGALELSVSQDVPPLSSMRDFPASLERLHLPELKSFLSQWERHPDQLEDSRATDWSRIEERMAYVVGLFRRFHTDPSVLASPA